MRTRQADDHEPRRDSRPRLSQGAKLRSSTIHAARLVPLILVFAAIATQLPQEIAMAQSSIAARKPAEPLTSAQLNDSMRKLESELLAKYGESQKARLR